MNAQNIIAPSERETLPAPPMTSPPPKALSDWDHFVARVADRLGVSVDDDPLPNPPSDDEPSDHEPHARVNGKSALSIATEL